MNVVTKEKVLKYKGWKLNPDGRFERQGYWLQADTRDPQFDPEALYRFAGPAANEPGVYLIEKLNPDNTGSGMFLRCRLIAPAPKAVKESALAVSPTEAKESEWVYISKEGKEFEYEGVRYRVIQGFAASHSRPYRVIKEGNTVWVVEIRNGTESKHKLLCESVNRPTKPQAPSPTQEAPASKTLSSSPTPSRSPAAADRKEDRKEVAKTYAQLPEGAFFLGANGRFVLKGKTLQVIPKQLQQLDHSLPVIYRGRHPKRQDVYVLEQLTPTGESFKPRPRVIYATAVDPEKTVAAAKTVPVQPSSAAVSVPPSAPVRPGPVPAANAAASSAEEKASGLKRLLSLGEMLRESIQSFALARKATKPLLTGLSYTECKKLEMRLRDVHIPAVSQKDPHTNTYTLFLQNPEHEWAAKYLAENPRNELLRLNHRGLLPQNKERVLQSLHRLGYQEILAVPITSGEDKGKWALLCKAEQRREIVRHYRRLRGGV